MNHGSRVDLEKQPKNKQYCKFHSPPVLCNEGWVCGGLCGVDSGRPDNPATTAAPPTPNLTPCKSYKLILMLLTSNVSALKGPKTRKYKISAANNR